jgi:hypothetical protein
MVYQPNFYDPEQAVAAQRERLYWLTLVSGVESIVAIAMHLAGVDNFVLNGLIIGGVAGALIVAGIRGRTDGYYQDLVAVGMRWAAFALGIFILLSWASENTSLIGRLIPGFDALNGDTYLLALSLALIFHAGYAFAYLRDLITSRGRK